MHIHIHSLLITLTDCDGSSNGILGFGYWYPSLAEFWFPRKVREISAHTSDNNPTKKIVLLCNSNEAIETRENIKIDGMNLW